MSNKQKQIEDDDQADSQKYTEREYQAMKKENAQVKLAVEDDCDRGREITAELKDADVNVTISVAGKDFTINRAILSASSSILANLLEANCANRLVIDDVAVDVFKSLLSFIGTGNVPALEPKMAEDLLAVTDKYQLEQLKSTAEDYLCSQLSLESVASLRIFAEAVNASKLKDKCLELLNSLASPSITPRPIASLPPVARLHDPCLIALFKQLPPADQLTARTVCSRWADLVTYAARSTRSLAILVGDQTITMFKDSLNYYSLGKIKVVSLLQKEDGSPMFPLERYSQWNTLLYRGGLDEATVEAIAGTFVNLNTLQIGLYKVPSQFDFISHLLEQWAHQLTTLKLYEAPFRPPILSTDRLFAAINGIIDLTNLYLDLSTLPYHELPIISQLEQLCVRWERCPPHQFVTLLRMHATANTALRRIDYFCSNPDSPSEHFTSLGDHLLSRFTYFGAPLFQFTNSQLISTHFRHLTSLYIRPTNITIRRVFDHLSQLTQLLYLHLEINFSLILPDDQPHLLLLQLKSVKALQLGVARFRSHHQLEPLKISWTMPNVEVIEFTISFPWSECTDCSIEEYFAEHIKAKPTKYEHCYRQMLASLKANCTKLRTILYDCEDIFGSVDKLLA